MAYSGTVNRSFFYKQMGDGGRVSAGCFESSRCFRPILPFPTPQRHDTEFHEASMWRIAWIRRRLAYEDVMAFESRCWLASTSAPRDPVNESPRIKKQESAQDVSTRAGPCPPRAIFSRRKSRSTSKGASCAPGGRTRRRPGHDLDLACERARGRPIIKASATAHEFNVRLLTFF